MEIIVYSEIALLVLGSIFISINTVTKHGRFSDNFGIASFICTPFKYLLERLKAWNFLYRGPDLIQRAFNKANGRPFEILAPDTRCVFVSSPEQIQELDSAPDTVLSLQAASKQMLQPQYSMHGFNWFDRRGTEGVGFIRAVRTLLTTHLPKILPTLRHVLMNKMTDLIAEQKSAKGGCDIPVYPMIVKLVVIANSFSFFGEELARNDGFMEAALAYVEETLLIAEVIRLTPRCLHSIIGLVLTRRASSQAVVYESLLKIAEERVQHRNYKFKGERHNDCIQWIMETSPRNNPWSPQRIVFELMAIWFGSVHAMSTTTTFAIHDLCLHPEYVVPLREELQSLEYTEFERTANGLPLLDSFIKESARLTPVESLSTRRQALKPFSFADGTKLHVGDWACTPVRALMQDGKYYPLPLEFSGFRFVDPKVFSEKTAIPSRVMQPRPSKLTDTTKDFHVWGTGRMSCPGRYYASTIMKILVAQIIIDYDVDLVDKTSQRWWTWRSSMLPAKSTMVRFS